MVKESDLPGFEKLDSFFNFGLEAFPELLVAFPEPTPTPYDVFKLFQRGIFCLSDGGCFKHVEKGFIVELEIIGGSSFEEEQEIG